MSVGPSGEEGWGDSANPSMSRDGRYIAFETDAEEFHPSDGNISYDIYVRDRLARTTQRASEKSNGFEAFGDAWSPSISPEGRFVGFYSDSEEFACTGCDTNDDDDVYMKDMGAPFLTQPAGAGFKGVTPKLLLDTSSGAKLAGGSTLDVQVTGGSTTVPADATAVVLNVTSSAETASGAIVTLYPTGVTRPPTVALHPRVGASVSNQVISKVGTNGQVRFYTNTGATHLRVDVVGYFAPNDGDDFTPITVPAMIDTRGPSVPAGWPKGQKLVAGGAFADLPIQATGTVGVPDDARAVAVQITAVDPTVANAKLTIRPFGAANPGTPNVVPQPGAAVSNLAIVPVGDLGKLSLNLDSGATHVVVAIVGYFGPSAASLLFPVNPARVVDTRTTNGTGVPGHSGPILPLEPLFVPYAGRGGVPTDANAVALTTSSADATSNLNALIVWPAGAFPVLVSVLNYRVGTNATNTMLPDLGLNGGVGMYNYSAGSVHVFSDVYGYFR